MNAPAADPFTALRALIGGDRRCEEECSTFLSRARSLLVASNEILEEAYQYRGSKGISDYIIVCREYDGVGNGTPKAYVWELKAPQCYLFAADTDARVRPSDDFVSAENQLLHYFHEYRGWAEFRRRFSLMDDDDIGLGGIIIGSRNRLVSGGSYDQTQRLRLSQTALAVRHRYLYRPAGMRVLDWDTVADFIKPPTKVEPMKRTPEGAALAIAGALPTIVNSGSP